METKDKNEVKIEVSKSLTIYDGEIEIILDRTEGDDKVSITIHSDTTRERKSISIDISAKMASKLQEAIDDIFD